jgi:hypothetical protein
MIAGLASIFEPTFTTDFGVRTVAEPVCGLPGRFDDYARVKAYAEAILHLTNTEVVFKENGPFLPQAKTDIPIIPGESITDLVKFLAPATRQRRN